MIHELNGINTYERCIMGRPKNNYDDFSKDILESISNEKYYLSNPDYGCLSRVPMDRDIDVKYKSMLVNFLRFFDKGCKIVNNKFNKHLLANIGYFNIVLIDDSHFEINSTSDYYEIINYINTFPNVRLCGGKINFYSNSLQWSTVKYLDLMEILNYKTVDKYNNDFVEHQAEQVGLPNKLLRVLGISDVYSDLQHYKEECKSKQTEIDELEKELDSLRKKQKIVDEIIKNSVALASMQ